MEMHEYDDGGDKPSPLQRPSWAIDNPAKLHPQIPSIPFGSRSSSSLILNGYNVAVACGPTSVW